MHHIHKFDGHEVLMVEGISAGYPGERRAIMDISFSVQCGERIAVIGPNGAGKSTLFKTLVGIIPHTTGHISLNGAPCNKSHGMIGYVPQQSAIDWRFPVSVWDVVMMGRVRRIGWLRWPRRADREAVMTALEQVHMTELKGRQIGDLSGGQRQRVFIARALAQETDVLLLDEPFNGVDASVEEDIMSTLDELQEIGITLMIATHDLQLASTQFDRVLVINREVIAYGDPSLCFSPDVLREAYGRRVGVLQANGGLAILQDSH